MNIVLKEVIPVGEKEAVNVQIVDGRIAYIGTSLPEADRVIEGQGALLSAGWMDMRAFFGDPGLEQRETIASGCAAAAAGGFTDVALLPNTKPVIQGKHEVNYVRHAAPAHVGLHPMGAVTVNTEGKEITEMIDLHAAGVRAFTDGTKGLWHTGVVLKTLQYLQKFDGLLVNRAADQFLTGYGVMHEGLVSTQLGMPGIPAAAEEIAITRDLQLLEYAGGRLHFATVSTAGGVQLIKEARARGLEVSCDVAAHQLIYEDTALQDFDTSYKVDPPFRSAADREALIAGLEDGTIDAIVSDHQPHDPEGKELEFDLAEFGITGLQTVLPYLVRLSDRLPWPLLINKVCHAPRRLMQLPSVKVEEGAVANLTLFDPATQWTFNARTNASLAVNSPLYGEELRGRVLATVRGEHVYENS